MVYTYPDSLRSGCSYFWPNGLLLPDKKDADLFVHVVGNNSSLIYYGKRMFLYVWYLLAFNYLDIMCICICMGNQQDITPGTLLGTCMCNLTGWRFDPTGGAVWHYWSCWWTALACNEWLKHIKIKLQETCSFCHSKNTITHFYYRLKKFNFFLKKFGKMVGKYY